jgi:thioredoxin-related protein
MNQAKEQNRAVLLFFCADWCATCIKMEKETFKNKSVISYLKTNFISIKVKFDRQQKIANKYRVRGLPTTVLINSNGKKSGPLPGYISADRLLGLLKKFLHPG